MESTAGTVTCLSCGQPAPAGAGFCPGCGRLLSAIVYAGFWIRFVAWLIDAIILTIPNIIIGLVVESPGSILLQFAIGIVYTIGFWTAEGATPGKMAMGLRITTVQGEPVDFGKAVLRYIGYFVSGITLGIGYLMIAFTREKRGLHDYIAGTMVVKAR